MIHPPRVLIVDESAEARDILRTLLERCGAVTVEAEQPGEAVRLANQQRPDLIVLDIESDHSPQGNAADELRIVAGRMSTPVVFLGTLSRRFGQDLADQFIAKPYHYGPLIRKIEGLLAAA